VSADLSQKGYSQDCVDLVKRCEDEAGFLAGHPTRLKAYRCPAGRWTAGWGTTKGVTAKTVFTAEEAERRLREDLDEAAAIVRKWVTVPLSQGQTDALVSFVQNVGPGQPESHEGEGGKDGFVWLRRREPSGSPRHSTLLKHLLARAYDAAAAEFPKWCWAGDQMLDGLRRRRLAEQEMFRG
jgi:lysozyme